MPPVTRSQAQRRVCKTNRDVISEDVPKAKQRRLRKKDPDVVVDQEILEDQRLRALVDTSLKPYDQGYEALVWGDGSMGQLGLAVEEDPLCVLPKPLVLSTSVSQVAAGGMHTLMLMSDGTLQTFGSNDEGALGRKTVGEVWNLEEADDETMPQSVPALVEMPEVRVTGIACTDSGCFVWSEDGRIFGWGAFRPSHGLMGFSEEVTIQKSAACVHHPNTIERAAIKLATGGSHVLALLKDGSVLSWGDGERGQLGRVHPERDGKGKMLTPMIIPGLSDIVDVFCGESTSFFKATDGTIFACGLNSSGQLGMEPDPAYAQDHCPTIESSVRYKALFLEPTEILSLRGMESQVQNIVSGKRHTLVLTNKGEVYSFGSPTYGVLGRSVNEGDTIGAIPEKIGELEGHQIVHVAAGQDCSACIDSEGILWRFGGEHSGLMCVGWDGSDILIPEQLKKGKAAKTYAFVSVEFGGQHGILLGKR